MPIPAFDSILNVLPPHLGNPAQLGDLSPYPCNSRDVCERFNGTEDRRKILTGFLDFRELMLRAGIHGVQWLSGSFVENIESQEGRPPNDIDVVTIVYLPFDQAELQAAILKADPKFFENKHIKTKYCVDHFLMPLGLPPQMLIRMTRYWYGLFSHRRDRTWKGLLQVPLNDQSDDLAARDLLRAEVRYE